MDAFKNQRDAAAWMIRQGRALLDGQVASSPFISRRDNNAAFEMGWKLISIGRRVAMGYKFGDPPPTEAIYRSHLQDTSPARLKRLALNAGVDLAEVARRGGSMKLVKRVDGWWIEGVPPYEVDGETFTDNGSLWDPQGCGVGHGRDQAELARHGATREAENLLKSFPILDGMRRIISGCLFHNPNQEPVNEPCSQPGSRNP